MSSVPQSIVESVIYFYVFVCVMLMVFNVLYIARSSWVERKKRRRARYWKKQIDKADGPFVLSDAQVRKLMRVQDFAAFHRAIILWVLGTESSDQFFYDNASQIQKLALAYARREAMERAFMASFIASFRCSSSSNAGMLAEILLSYFQDSTVFCRENTLQALYALGRPHAVENAFHIMNEQEWYHSPKLLSDGMTMYTGDMEELVLMLWRNHGRWAESLNVAIVQFASFLDSPTIAHLFEDELLNGSVTTEVRFTLIRYFQKHRSENVLQRLLGFANEDGIYAIAAVGALSSYDCEQSRAALKRALCSPNWHVRHNAALSLSRVGLTPAEREEIEAGNDRYAIEMLDYVMGPA